MKRIFILIFLFMQTLTGCTSTSNLYYWGHYEDMVYNRYVTPGSTTAQQQIDLIMSDIQAAEEKQMKPAPGIYAQLGVAAVENNQRSLAEASFAKEAELYPESKHFMDYLLQQLKSRDHEKSN